MQALALPQDSVALNQEDSPASKKWPFIRVIQPFRPMSRQMVTWLEQSVQFWWCLCSDSCHFHLFCLNYPRGEPFLTVKCWNVFRNYASCFFPPYTKLSWWLHSLWLNILHPRCHHGSTIIRGPAIKYEKWHPTLIWILPKDQQAKFRLRDRSRPCSPGCDNGEDGRQGLFSYICQICQGVVQDSNFSLMWCILY